MLKHQENPFIVGDWIKRDEDFIGRRDLIARLTRLSKNLVWLIGARRMGKTSLLRYLQRRFHEQSEVIALFWDVSGADSSSDLVETLLDALAAAPDELARLGTSLAACEHQFGIIALVRGLYRRVQAHGLRLVLLVDESEALLKIAAQERSFSERLSALLEGSAALHVIMASNHGYEAFDELDTLHLISPFLQPFMPPLYLPPWRASEAASVAARATTLQSEQDMIVADSGRLPFLVQMLCFYRFASEGYEGALQQMEREQMLDLFFRDDFNHFDESSRQLLARIATFGPLSVGELAQRMVLNRKVRQRLDLLQQLGFLQQDSAGRFQISNIFLKNWIDQVYLPGNPLPESSIQEKPTLFDERIVLHHSAGRIQLRHERGGRLEHISEHTLEQALPLALDGGLARAEEPCELGSRLFAQLFDQGEYWLEVLNQAPPCTLVFQDFDVQCPVEYLHDGIQFLAPKHPLCREPSQAGGETVRLQVGPDLRVLLIASDTPPMLQRIDRELTLLEEQLRRQAAAIHLNLILHRLYSHQCCLETLRLAAVKQPYDIIHYAGHSSTTTRDAEACLYFRSRCTARSPVEALSITDFLVMFGSVQLFYLNSCGTRAVGGPLGHARADWPARYLIHLRDSVTDEYAARFALDFYRLLFQHNLNPVTALQLNRCQWFNAEQAAPSSQLFALEPIIYQLR